MYLASAGGPRTRSRPTPTLKDWFAYLAGHSATGGPLRWRTSPGSSPDSSPGCGYRRRPATEGRGAAHGGAALRCGEREPQAAALASFCEFHARQGVALAGLLVTMQPAGRRAAATSISRSRTTSSRTGRSSDRTIS